MKIRDIMNQPAVSCRQETDLAAAARLMLDGRFGTLPVVDDHHVVGVITDRDIAMAVASSQRGAKHIAVHEAMTQPPHCCTADDDVTEALHGMANARVRRLPVVDAQGRLSGIVSIDDVVQRAVDQEGGVPSAILIKALVRISERPSVEPEFNFADTFVPG